MNIKRNILIYPDKEGSESTGYKPDAKLRMRIRWGKNIVNFNVGYRVVLDKWSTEAQRCKAGTTHGKKKNSAFEINNEIQRLVDIADKVFKSFEIMDITPDVSEFRDAFNEMNGKTEGEEPTRKNNLFAAFDEFVISEGRNNEWTEATFTKFHAIKKHLSDYNSKLSLDNLSEKDLQGYIQYLHGLNLRNSTIKKNLSFVRWFLRWAAGKQYYLGNLHMSFRPKFKGTKSDDKEVIYLEWTELQKMFSFQFNEGQKYLERVRDVFCFECFTGLRYSDVAKLKRSDIKENHIEVVTKKTNDRLKIELNDYSRAILQKYEGVEFPGGKVLPVISNVNMNVYLKELGELCGIDEPQRITYFKGNERIEEVHPKYDLLTTHAGRRTFVVTALYLGIPAEVVMQWTGHSDYKSMRPYVEIVNDLKEKSMMKFNKVFEK